VLKDGEVDRVFNSLRGDITYTHTKIHHAKKIAGERAYKLAREEREVKLKEITSTIYDIELLLYNHPIYTLRFTISEGGYIRSIGEIIPEGLRVDGTLSSLRRVS